MYLLFIFINIIIILIKFMNDLKIITITNIYEKYIKDVILFYN